MAQDPSDAIRRIEADIRTLETALHALRKQRESGADAAFSQNSASSDRIKGK